MPNWLGIIPTWTRDFWDSQTILFKESFLTLLLCNLQQQTDAAVRVSHIQWQSGISFSLYTSDLMASRLSDKVLPGIGPTGDIRANFTSSWGQTWLRTNIVSYSVKESWWKAETHCPYLQQSYVHFIIKRGEIKLSFGYTRPV